MDFEAAARRLEKDQSQMRGRRGPPPVSAKAKREAEYRKKQQEKLRAEREKKKLQLQLAKHYMTSCERALGVASLGDSHESPLCLTPTSIHGDGDKIALPPSVLQHLTERDQSGVAGSSSPWIFRIGVPRPGYSFPASRALNEMPLPSEDDAMEDSDDDEENTAEASAAYLEELSHKYISYTHGTVVEFTQDEGFIGLPASIASALLDRNRWRQDDASTEIPTTRTVDPAAAASIEDKEASIEGAIDVDEEKTPGHTAWGVFDIPDTQVEVSLIKVPKGKACTLVPTEAAIRNGFYGLKDIKLVLEQSLIRTRATLSVGDLVHTWHRGFKYDLVVSSVSPPDYHVVSCINTDIEVDFGRADISDELDDQVKSMDTDHKQVDSSFAPGPGRVLSSSSTSRAPAAKPTPHHTRAEVLPEPPIDQKEGVCTVQIRAPNGATGRHRFDVTRAKLSDLFSFAATLSSEEDLSAFRLVTRFPRKEYCLDKDNDVQTLEDAGISAGQELFLLERI